MGWARSHEPHRSRSTGTDAIDLLGFAFNVPTRHDLRRHREIAERRQNSRTSDSSESGQDDFDDSDAVGPSDSESEDDNVKEQVICVASRHRSPDRHTPLRKTSKKNYQRASSRSSDFDSKSVCEKKQKKKSRSSSTRSPIPKKLSKSRKSRKDSAEILTTTPASQHPPLTKPKHPTVGTKTPLSNTHSSPLGPSAPGELTWTWPTPAQQPSAPVVAPQHFQHPVFLSPSASHGPVQTPHQMFVNHMFAPPSQPMYLASPTYFAAQYVTSSPQATTNSNSSSSLQNIERIQHETHHLEQSQLPLKKKAHAEQLKKLHAELNATLDAATAQASGNGPTVSNPELGQALQPNYDPLTTPIPRQQQKANDLSHPENDGEDTNPRTCSSKESLRYHLCSNCGNIRSQRFHQKHPMRMGQKALFNHCESCRETRSIHDGSNSYHFCFGCGLVRSKMYQDAHPVQKGCTMPTNYCRKCVQEVRQDEKLEKMSITEGDSMASGSTLLAKQSSRLDGKGTRSSFSLPMGHIRAEQESRFNKRDRRSYRQPFVEDSSSVTHRIAEDAGQEKDHGHGHATRPVDVLSEDSVKEYARRSSLDSEHTSRHSSPNKRVSFDLANFHVGSDHDSERDIRPRGVTEAASEAFHQVPRVSSNCQGERSREARPSQDRESKEPCSRIQSGSQGAPMARSAFAGMHFAQRNRFGPPTAPAPLSRSPTHAHSSHTLNDEPDHVPDCRTPRSTHACSAKPDGRSPAGREQPSGTRARSSSSFSTGTTTFTAFTPTSPNPYYTPQTSPSLFEDGIFERINLRKRRADRKKHEKGQMYEPTPITEEILSVVDEEMDPILFIDCIPYSDETASISSPECAWSSSNSAGAAR